MRAVWLVARHEIVTKLTQRSFVLATFGLPIVGVLLFSATAALNRRSPDLVQGVIESPEVFRPAGYVDPARVLTAFPDAVPADAFRPYRDEPAARRALDGGEIGAYFVIPPDVVAGGEVELVQGDPNAIAASRQSDWLEQALILSLLGGDETLAARLGRPVEVRETALAPKPPRDEDDPLTFFLPYALTLMFYMVIFGAASHNLGSMTAEKENRVIEILMTSLAPRRMLAGKVLGLGILGLMQAALWIGTSYWLVQEGGSAFQLPAEFRLSPALVAWGLVYFVLGYAVYASLMAGIGALVPNLREAAQAAFVVNSPLILALVLMGVIIQDPDGRVAVALSLFPFTAPVVMMTRLAAGDAVPLWQLLLAAALLVATVVLVIRAVAGLFRTQVLLAGQPLDVRRLRTLLAARTKVR